MRSRPIMPIRELPSHVQEFDWLTSIVCRRRDPIFPGDIKVAYIHMSFNASRKLRLKYKRDALHESIDNIFDVSKGRRKFPFGLLVDPISLWCDKILKISTSVKDSFFH
ncbi:hypothetical protein AG1IA_05090 [Rhizoctonia solani AG-1 IA]|uniref:Uncharacterized protein n=1 Tax=Thanatephorus cucumeris (strain AG1-IA) TaxID=983506 RepID=L8WVP8_THACA|nr:hypothetical protein AG1IA_05090 [Rhizoctonia solani AG-1 IA]